MDQNRQQWLTMAAVVLVVGGLGYFLFRQSRVGDDNNDIDIEEIVAEERADELIEQMNVEIPEDADRATLKDVVGGDSAGVATRTENGESREYSLLAALPDPEPGVFYEGYLEDDQGGESTYLGKLRQAKGGWMLEFESRVSLPSESSQVVVTREKVDDRVPEETVLEGAFK